MRTVSYATLLTAFAGAARAGRATLQPGEEEQMCADLTAAALHLWEVETYSMALPDMLTGKEVTPDTDGVIDALTIQRSSFWSVWASDPRAASKTERERLRLETTQLGDGSIQLLDAAPTPTVYVLYKTPPPQWTTVAVNSQCLYQTGDLVKCEGRVYQALLDDAPGSDLQDTGYWLEMVLPQSLQRVVLTKANFERIRLGTNMPENAGREAVEYERCLDAAFMAAKADAKPWLFNQNQ